MHTGEATRDLCYCFGKKATSNQRIYIRKLHALTTTNLIHTKNTHITQCIASHNSKYAIGWVKFPTRKLGQEQSYIHIVCDGAQSYSEDDNLKNKKIKKTKELDSVVIMKDL